MTGNKYYAQVNYYAITKTKSLRKSINCDLVMNKVENETLNTNYNFIKPLDTYSIAQLKVSYDG